MDSKSASSNRKLAQNTLYMYVRMFFQLIISLYTSRVVLNTLGVEDFGTYNVVGGIVALFSIINGTLRSATSRFITYEVGKGTMESINKVFSISLMLYFFLTAFVLILGETLGLWFVQTQMNFPENRMLAVFWVYQTSLIAFCIKMMIVPYESIIISHEKFNFFAITGILESLLQLAIVSILVLFKSDKLITYAILILLVSVMSFTYLYFYSHKVTIASKFRSVWDKFLFKEMFSFSGWSLFGSFAQVGANQAINIFVNIFLGITVNAAVGIASQVNGAVYRFVGNFQTAFQPQIIKSIARNETQDTFRLINQTTKISYYLMFVLALPLFFCVNFALKVWLKVVPEFTAQFCLMTLLFSLVDALAGPLYMSALALSNIKIYQIALSIIVVLNIPLIYLVLKFNFPPYWIFVVRTLLNFVAYIFRILYLRKYIRLSITNYLKELVMPILIVTTISALISYQLANILTMDVWSGVVPFIMGSVLATFITAFFIGFKKSERMVVILFIKSKLAIN